MKNTILFKSKSENTISPIRLQRNGSMKNLNCHVDEPESCDGGRGTLGQLLAAVRCWEMDYCIEASGRVQLLHEGH